MKPYSQFAIVIFSFLSSPIFSVAHAIEAETKSQLISVQNKIETLTPEEVAQSIADFGGEAAVDISNVVKAVFAKFGEPSALIVGNEMQGSFLVGYRRGNGKFLFRGERDLETSSIRWGAPSVGINVGATMSKVAILVYGADNAEQLKQRFISMEGSYHFIGGAGVSYMTNALKRPEESKVTLVYISVGLGLDAGVAIESLSFK